MEENNIETTEEFEVLKTAMSLIRQGDIGITITQLQTRDEETIGKMDIAERVLKEGLASVHFGGDYVFLDIDFKHAKGMDANAVNHFLKQWSQKETDALLEKKEIENRFYFGITIVAVAEDKMAYGIKMINPAFWTMEESTLKMSFPKTQFSFFRQEIDEKKERADRMRRYQEEYEGEGDWVS